MKKSRKIVDARNNADGTVSHVRLDGNVNFTPVARAITMADRGEISNAHTVRRANAKLHLRTNADGQERNNLDYLADQK
ncbi:DUF3892 domain-containing protein [Rhizorhabdus sp. FW153]|uniref:DUF3892 domain-containing protein n=1 Tax=Rhizorhabdus sp. FW153 TaxID=3400216 RepID=UPI003CF62B19